MAHTAPPSVHIGPLAFVELVSGLNRLVEGSDAALRERLALDADDQAFLETLAKFRLKGLQFLEFALLLDAPGSLRPKSLEGNLKVLQRLSDSRFAGVFLGGDLEPALIVELLADPNRIDAVLAEEAYRFLDRQEVETLLAKLKPIRAGFASVIRKLAPCMVPDVTRYATLERKVASALVDRDPLAVAQGFMGKTFKRVDDYRQFWFVPSVFFAHRTMRIFSSEILMVVIPVDRPTQAPTDPRLVQFLKAIGDGSRLAILRRLAERPHSGKELAERLSLRTATITHHLEQLRQCGLLHEERDRNTKYVSLDRNAYQDYLQALMQIP